MIASSAIVWQVARSGSTLPPTIAQQMAALWRGKAHFEELRSIDWAKSPYNAPEEGWGWFGIPMPFAGGTWYLFNRVWQTPEEKPHYCRDPGWRVVIRKSSDAARSSR